MNATLHNVDLWWYYVCCICSGVTRCTIFIVLYLCLVYQCWLHALRSSHIGILMSLLAAEPCTTAGLSLPSQYFCEKILLTLYSMVWDCRFQDQGQCLFIGLADRSPFGFNCFPFHFLMVGLGRRTIWCKSFSLSLALQTFLNINNYNKKNNNNNAKKYNYNFQFQVFTVSHFQHLSLQCCETLVEI